MALVNTVTGGAARMRCDKIKEEIILISKEIEKVRLEGSKAALNEGKITEEFYSAQVKVSNRAIIEGAFLGTMFGGFYGAVIGSRLQNLNKELVTKLKELNNAIEQARNEKISTQ